MLGIKGIRERKAEKIMTYEQEMASIYREKHQKIKKEMKFDGIIKKAEVEYPESYRATLEFEAEKNGHVIEGDFYFKVCDERCCWYDIDIDRPISIRIDGKEVSEEAVVEFIKENLKVLQSRARGYEYEKKSPASVIERHKNEELAKEEIIKKENLEKEKEDAKLKQQEEQEKRVQRGKNEIAELLK